MFFSTLEICIHDSIKGDHNAPLLSDEMCPLDCTAASAAERARAEDENESNEMWHVCHDLMCLSEDQWGC